MRLINPILKALLIIVCIPTFADAQNLQPPDGVTFSVSATVADQDPVCDHADEVGLDIRLSFRLSTTNKPISVLVMFEPAVLRPMGNAISVRDGKYVWRSGAPGASVASENPVSAMCRVAHCRWVELAPHSALEWEQCDVSPRRTEMRAQTIFVKEQADAPERQMISTPYRVDGRPPMWQ